MFPALAGMNRQLRRIPHAADSVPRARGDEPEWLRDVLWQLSVFPALAGMNPGVGPNQLVQWTFRGALESEDGTVRAAVANMRCWCSEVDWGDWKPGEQAALKLKAEVRYYKLEHDGAVVHEIDADNMVRIVNGTDRLEAQRAALGI